MRILTVRFFRLAGFFCVAARFAVFLAVCQAICLAHHTPYVFAGPQATEHVKQVAELWAKADNFNLRFTQLHDTEDEKRFLKSITAIEQDRFGFIWIGTMNGLLRYDGYEIKLYNTDNRGENSLSHNSVSDILEDSRGRLWVGTEGGGVNLYDPESDGFKHFKHDPKNKNSLGGDYVFCMFEDKDNILWFGGPPRTGLNRYDPESNEFTHFFPSDISEKSLYNPSGVWEIAQDASGAFWMAADFVLTRMDPTNNTFEHYHPSATEQRLNALTLDANGGIWVGGTTGLYSFNPDTKEFTSHIAESNIELNVDALYLNPAGRLMVGTEGNGLFIFDPQKKRFLNHCPYDPDDAYSISGHSVGSLFVDNTNLMWVGTRRGLDIVTPFQTQFSYYGRAPSNPNTLSGDHVDAISGGVNSQGEIQVWLGLDFTLNQLAPGSGFVRRHKLNPALIDIGGEGICALHADSQGAIWFGLAADERLYRFTPETGAIATHYPLGRQKSVGPAPRIEKFLSDGERGFYFIMTHRGLFYYNAQEDSFTAFVAPPPQNAKAPDAANRLLMSLTRDYNGDIWMGSMRGDISRFNARTRQFTHFTPTPNRVNGLPETVVEDLHVDANGVVWAATHKGLLRLDPDKNTHKLYTTKHGLPTDQLKCIEPDDKGRLWIGAQYGMVMFDPAADSFTNFTEDDGLPVFFYNPRARWKDHQGKIYFAGVPGAMSFDPGQTAPAPFHPPVVLTDMALFNHHVDIGSDSILKRPIWQTSALTLEYDQNVLSFSFAALNFLGVSDITYRYTLEGFDKQWNETKLPNATYTGLPPGKYELKVQAGHDAHWSPHEISLGVTILPPWWKTWWFRTLALCLAAALLYSAYAYRVRSLKQREAQLEKTVQERTRELQATQKQLRASKEAAESANEAKSSFLANMSHELRTPLNAIIGFSQIMGNNRALPAEERKTLGIILRSGEHLLTLINQVLDLSKIEAGRITLNTNDFNLGQLLYDVERMFDFKARDKGLELKIDLQASLPQSIHADELKLRQILINLLNNAIKFTDVGSITLQAHADPTTDQNGAIRLHFSVQDTGPGIAEKDMQSLFEAFVQTETGRTAKEGTGLGLTISRKFVELMGGRMRVQSEVGLGSNFFFDINALPAKESVPSKSTASSEDMTRDFGAVTGLAPGQPEFRLLVVDDQAENRSVLVKLLQPLGFALRSAENGQQGVDVWDTWRPHLILMDMRMPVMDGREAARRIKASAGGEKTIIVAVSASSFEDDRAQALSAGCDAFLSKPFRTEDLLRILQKRLKLQYVYEEQDEEQERAQGAVGQDAATKSAAITDVTAEALALLSEDVRKQLHLAVDRMDFDMAMECVDRVEQEHPDQGGLAAALRKSVESYRFDYLLNIFDEL